MSLPQCLEKYVCQVKHDERSKCLRELQEPLLQEKVVEKIADEKSKQLRSGEGCAQELPKSSSWKPVSKFTPGARAPMVTASPGCEEKDDQAAWPFYGFHV